MKTKHFQGGFVSLLFQLIYILYSLNGLVYSNGLVTNVLMIFSVLLSTYYCILVNLKFSNSFSRVLTVFILLYLIYFFIGGNKIVFSISGMPITSLSTLKVVLFAMMPFFPFYYIANKYDYTIYNKKIIFFYLILFFIAIGKYIMKRNENDFNGVVGGVNVAYTFVACLPILAVFMRKKMFFYIGIAILMILILSAMKRGAIIVGMLAIFIGIYNSLKSSSMLKSSRITNIIVLTIIISILLLILYNIILSNEALLNRFSEISEGGSGRDIIYTTLLYKWLDSDMGINFFLGYGINTTIRFTGFYAHNDWLEALITFGLLGVSIYTMMLYRLYKCGKTIEDYIGKTIIMMITIIWLMSSLFSMFFFSTLTFVYMMLIGIILGNNDKKIRQNINY